MEIKFIITRLSVDSEAGIERLEFYSESGIVDWCESRFQARLWDLYPEAESFIRGINGAVKQPGFYAIEKVFVKS